MWEDKFFKQFMSIVQGFLVLRVFDLREFQIYAIFFCSRKFHFTRYFQFYAILDIGKCRELEEIGRSIFENHIFAPGWRKIPIFSRFGPYVKFGKNSQRDAIHLAWVNRRQFWRVLRYLRARKRCRLGVGGDWIDLSSSHFPIFIHFSHFFAGISTYILFRLTRFRLTR